MKKMIFALMMMLTAAMSASAMSYEQARNEALFLTDKMAYELNLTDAQYEAAYEINLDYLMGVTSVDDVFGTYWERRNLDLSYILYSWQWDAFSAASYFFRPLYWETGYWHFRIYARYPRRDYFYFGRPHFYATYRGGHAWHLNGGRSYYQGRATHFRPALPQGRSHYGMRNSYDRGDYRGSRRGSSTRVTGHYNRQYQNGRQGNSNYRQYSNYNNSDNNSGYNNRGNRNGYSNRGSNSSYERSNSGHFSRNNNNSGSYNRGNNSSYSNRSSNGSYNRGGNRGSSSNSGSFSRNNGGGSTSGNRSGHFSKGHR